MSFLKISDPAKRDAMVKEYLDLKKNIRDNVLSERTGEMELQTDLSKFYRPITETQKATAREITEGLKHITEGLKPIREGIENLPQAIQPIGEASGKEYPLELGEIAKHFLNRPDTDTTFGIRKEKGLYYIGDKQATIADNNILIADEKFTGTSGLWDLITSKNPNIKNFTGEDYENYKKLIIKTNVLHHNNDPNNPHPKSSAAPKWTHILGPIWEKKKEGYKGKGIVVIPSDPNALLERLDLLLASQEAGHTGVGNELVSICDELKRRGVLDTKTYKKLNSIIKK